VLASKSLNLVVVDRLGLHVEAVWHDVEPLAREVDRRSVREVPAHGEVHAEDRVAGVADRVVDREVRGCAGVRLHVRVIGTEQLLGALARQILNEVDLLAPTVVALARKALGVLVGEDGTGRFEYGHGDEVLGCDQFDGATLARQLGIDGRSQLRVLRGNVVQCHAGTTSLS